MTPPFFFSKFPLKKVNVGKIKETTMLQQGYNENRLFFKRVIARDS